jgi:hypothetical protein
VRKLRQRIKRLKLPLAIGKLGHVAKLAIIHFFQKRVRNRHNFPGEAFNHSSRLYFSNHWPIDEGTNNRSSCIAHPKLAKEKKKYS